MQRSTAESSARAAAMRKLAVDVVAREVLGAFADVQVRCILLKGSTLQDTLYGEQGLRRYADVDVLAARGDLPAARTALLGLGFERVLDPLTEPLRIPDPHAEDWRRGHDAVDLHWRVPGVHVADEAAWDLLWTHTERTAIATQPVTRLDHEATALLLALHAAHHGTDAPKPLEDLARGLEKLDLDTWSRAARLAAGLNATEAFGAGLRTLPAGAELAGRLGVPAPSTRMARLKAGPQPATATAVLSLVEMPRARRPRALLDALVPSREFMRAEFPLARRGRRGLALAYLVRAAKRARQLPAAIAAVRSSRTGGP